VSDAEILEKTEMRQLVYVTTENCFKWGITGAYPGFFLEGAQNPIFPFFTIFSPILAIFPRFNHFREEVLKRVLKPP